MKYPCAFLLALLPLVHAGGPDHFAPSQRVSGIGISRDDISDALLEVRTERMIESQTFSIMREAQAVPGAKRVTGNPKLQALIPFGVGGQRRTGVGHRSHLLSGELGRPQGAEYHRAQRDHADLGRDGGQHGSPGDVCHPI